ncbi:MAG TPA: LysM peptidoglycan-binding domain-containing protein [Anaerolineae bacterium]|nr:LysM peptidoglycan-binding domain-containing protein [Anaerolineae bacterium]
MSNNLDDLREDYEYENESEEEFDAEEVEEEETAGGGGGGFLRILLLLLIILALCICGGLFLLPQFGVNIPGLPDFRGVVPAIPAPGEQPPAEPPAEGETPVAGTVEPTVVGEVAPGEETVEPGAEEALPGEGTVEAEAVGEALPGEGTVEPGAEEAVPGEGTVEPETGEALPGEGTVEPGTEEAAPGEETVEPGAGEVTPGEGTTEPGAEEVAPGEGTVEPGAGEVTPGESDAAAEPGEDIVAEPQNCDANTDPVADAGGPYMAMQGKGQAIINFEGSASTDDGSIVSYEWDFGDGGTASEESGTYGYRDIGTFEVTLTVTDNCGASATDTTSATIVGPTPPANGDEDSDEDSSSGDSSGDEAVSDESGSDESSSDESSDETAASEPATPAEPAPEPAAAVQGTAGWCYQVQYGDTLTGIAYRYGVSVADLAQVNVVETHHWLRAGQGLFIPTGPIDNPPNVYVAQSGDTLYSIAYGCGLPVDALCKINNLSPEADLSPGQTIIIPPWQW